MSEQTGTQEDPNSHRPRLRPGQALTGFIESKPRFTHVGDGVPKFYARIGIEHYRRSEDGPVKAGTTYHHLVAFREAAEIAHEHMARGDHFIARGYVHEYTNNHSQADEEFIAVRIGHDPMHTDYTVIRDLDRQPARRQPPAVDHSPAFSHPTRPAQVPDAASLTR